MPSRASARRRCRLAGALTTRTTSTECSARVSNSSGNVEDGDPPPLRRRLAKERRPAGRDGGMNEPLQPLEGRRVAKHPLGKTRAIDAPLDKDAGKRVFDDLSLRARIECAHRRVGVEDRRAKGREHFGDGRFSHCDRAGQSRDHHAPQPFALCAARTSASTRARSSAVTSGRTPNQRSKAGAAWCSSMPSPPTTARPRPLARSMSGVVSGT